MSYLLALDQGTTSSRAILFDAQLNAKAMAQQSFALSTPQVGWVEQDSLEIWQSQLNTAKQAIDNLGLANTQIHQIKGIGIANQRETTIVWHKQTGQPIYPAIVWQDRRTADFCQQLYSPTLEEQIQEITGLKLDPYFSASKLAWILDHVPNARTLATKGELAFGTVDTWLIYQLTGEHVMDVSNASRTMLMDLHTLQWSDTLCELFDIPANMLPRIVASGTHIANTKKAIFGAEIPIYAAMGDQQAALFGHGCHQVGTAKNTYGTGCFMLMNTGQKILTSQHKLLTTLAWQQHNQPAQYAIEGSVFMAGAIVQWLRDNLGFIKNSADVEALAKQVNSSDGVVLVPAFTGLGAPHWQPHATASLTGLTRGTTKAHIARAALEAIAFQVSDVLLAMQQDAINNQASALTELRVDGGACQNDMLMQFQADILGVPVLRPTVSEATALGAVKMAGLVAGMFNINDLQHHWQLDKRFEPKMSADEREQKLATWQACIAKVI